LWALLVSTLALQPIAAAAQGTSASAEPLDEIVVTGTLIKRNKDSSQLVTTIDADEMRLRGTTDAFDILSAISQNQPVATPNDGARTGGLTSLANLRNLGPENTLVLVNGKRIANNPIFDNGVDLNTIPTALIQSVDVLSDGASSIYGSDAVAGVINFRTVEELQGVQYNLQTVQPQEKGGTTDLGSLAAGFGSLREDGWDLVAAVSSRERTAILSADRSFSDTSILPSHGLNNLFPHPFPANVFQTGTVSGANPYPNCFPPDTIPYQGGCGLNADAAGLINLQNPEKEKSAYARAATMIGDQKLSVEYLWAQSSVVSALTGTTLFGYTMPNTSPYFPGNGIVPAIPGLNPTEPIIIDSAFTPGGRRTTENLTDTDRILAELTGKSVGVDYDLWALRSTSDARLNTQNGALLISGINDGLAGTNGAPYINPFGAQSPAAAAYLKSITVDGTMAQGYGTLEMAGLSLNKNLIQLAAGPLSTALAFEWGRDTFEYANNPLSNLLEGAVVGTGVPAAGARDRRSVTGEVLVPITSGFSADASVREDDYSDFGSTVNPKLLLSYDVASAVNLHASYNTGFRAPTLPQLYAPQTLGVVSGLNNDPILCPGGVVNKAAGGIINRDCMAAFNTLGGGNPELEPEKSKAYAAGIGLKLPQGALPMGVASFTVDYWNYQLDNVIGNLSSAAIFGSPQQFASEIVRCSQASPQLRAQSDTCNYGGGGDPIAYINQPNQNVGTTRTSGVDSGVNWTAPTQYGTFSFSYRGTYVLKYDYQEQPGGPVFSRLGTYRDGYPVIKYNHYLTFGWNEEAWGAALQNRFKGGYEDCNCFVAPQYYDRVGVYSLWNLAGTYKFSDSLVITVHVDNLFNTNPPFTNQEDSNCTGCDLRFIDPTGRAFGVTLTGKFGGSGAARKPQ
jgi:iron complex outermembrane receptor protein